MISVHPYDTIARFYDLEHAHHRDDIEFYTNMLSASPVLEIGSGTGRIMEPLAQGGLEVWGVESSAEMLARARYRLEPFPQAHLVAGTVDDLPPGARFAAGVLSLNTLWHFASLQSQVGILRSLYAVLQPGGQLLVDCSNPLTMADREGRGEVRQRFREGSSDSTVTAYSSAWDNEAEQLLRLSLTYEEVDPKGQAKRSATELELRYVYRAELELLLRLGGFDVDHVYGDYDLEPYDATSPRLISVASRK